MAINTNNRNLVWKFWYALLAWFGIFNMMGTENSITDMSQIEDSQTELEDGEIEDDGQFLQEIEEGRKNKIDICILFSSLSLFLQSIQYNYNTNTFDTNI